MSWRRHAPPGASVDAGLASAHVGPARVFDFEDAAVEALLARQVQPGDVVVIRFEGPRANGMPEMYFATTIIAADPALSGTMAIVADGRFLAPPKARR